MSTLTGEHTVELGTGFAESAISDLEDPYPSTRSDSLQSYDYQSDSDLEDEEDLEEAVEHTPHGSTSGGSLSTKLGGKPEGLWVRSASRAIYQTCVILNMYQEWRRRNQEGRHEW